MNPCTRLHSYFDKRLFGREQLDFERHLSTCADCTGAAKEWAAAKLVLNATYHSDESVPTREMAARLLTAAAEEETVSPMRPRHFKRFAAFAIAASAAGLLWMGTGLLRENSRSSSTATIAKTTAAAAKNIPLEQPAAVPSSTMPRNPPERALSAGLQTVGGHRIWVESADTVRVETVSPISLHITRGSVVIDTDKAAAPITVKAASFTIRDIGTQFRVDYSPNERLEVTVAEGLVELDGYGEIPVRVQPGQTLTIVEQNKFMTIDEIDEPSRQLNFAPLHQTDPKLRVGQSAIPNAKTVRRRPAELKRWRKMVIDGLYVDAENAVSSYLEQSTGDVSAWSILSDCKRKQGDWQGAVDANQRVIALGNRQEKLRALFLNGEIYQDRLNNSVAALEVFDAFLAMSSPSSLRASALLRAAKVRQRLGDFFGADALLREIIEGPYDEHMKAGAKTLSDAR